MNITELRAACAKAGLTLTHCNYKRAVFSVDARGKHRGEARRAARVE